MACFTVIDALWQMHAEVCTNPSELELRLGLQIFRL